MRIFSVLFFLGITSAQAQQWTLSGDIVDDKATPLLYATVVLLNPADSTLAFFGISDANGHFDMKGVTAGTYLLQAAFTGYESFYKNISVPGSGIALGTIVMKPLSVDLKETTISAERIPVQIKKDTIEYNAAAFKTKPDASTEDLLKKLPGVEVDRAGNIKAQGENVKNVLVDGKEFFGSDPQLATKNIPADAIKKVQVYDKKSDEADMTGVDDGSRDKTINLLLKDDRKSAWMGEALAGAGSDDHYQVSAKAYRFTHESQFAVLGMLNNINKFGFSFRDYLDFNGGIGSLFNGDGNLNMTVNDDNSFPVNFGQPVLGKITSGAAGMNYTIEKRKDNRFNISYLGNGADKNLVENRISQQYVPGNSFVQNETSEENTTNRAHRLNFGWKNRIDSMQHLTVTGNASFTRGDNSGKMYLESFGNEAIQNTLGSTTQGDVNGVSAYVTTSYLKKFTARWNYIKISAEGSFAGNRRNNQWENSTHYFSPGTETTDARFQDSRNELAKFSATAMATWQAGKGVYLQPDLRAGFFSETLNQEQGLLYGGDETIDSLSPSLTSDYDYLRPGLTLKRNTDKNKFSVTAAIEAGRHRNTLLPDSTLERESIYFVPRIYWENEYKKGKRLSVEYESAINNPGAAQLLPTVDNSNPLLLYYGNRNLKSEQYHQARFNWMFFDSFSFTSLFVGLGGIYTRDKINVSKTIADDLSQTIVLVNVPYDYRGFLNAELSTPWRKWKLNTHVSIAEKWNKGISYINGGENINTNFTHAITVSADNRKKDKWDVSVGGTFSFTRARYSILAEQNNDYFNLTGFAELNFTPSERWHLSGTADLTRYNAEINSGIYIPLVSLQLSHYFLKANRGVVTLEVFDLLDQNTGIQRSSDLNYYEQRHTNTIGRYLMFTFKYRLNKFNDKGGVNIQVNGRG